MILSKFTKKSDFLHFNEIWLMFRPIPMYETNAIQLHFIVRLFWYLSQWSGSICSIFCTRLYSKDIHCVVIMKSLEIISMNADSELRQDTTYLFINWFISYHFSNWSLNKPDNAMFRICTTFTFSFIGNQNIQVTRSKLYCFLFEHLKENYPP